MSNPGQGTLDVRLSIWRHVVSVCILTLIVAPGTAGQIVTAAVEYLPRPADEDGQWSGPYSMEPLIDPVDTGDPDDDNNWREIVHLAILPPDNEGLVLFWNERLDFSHHDTLPPPAADLPQQTFLWNPQFPNELTVISIPNDETGTEEIFCGGHTFTTDGQLFVSGGTDGVAAHASVPGTWGSEKVFLFDNEDPPSWHELNDNDRARFYPTATRLGNGNILVGGHTNEGDGTTPYEDATRELGQITGTGTGLVVNWNVGATGQLTNYEDNGCATLDEYRLADYPRWHLLGAGPNAGDVFRTHQVHSFLKFDACLPAPPVLTGQKDRFERIDQGDSNRPQQVQMNSVHILWDDGLTTQEVIYAIGGSTQDGCGLGVVNEVRKMVNPSSTPVSLWEGGSFDMTYRRIESNSVILLDGSILVVGGFGPDTGFNPPTIGCAAMTIPELYEPPEIFGNPNATWQSMAPQEHERRYHSVAGLLPDGSVVSAGGTRQNGNPGPDPGVDPGNGWSSIEVFKPPYFFSIWGRPRITSVPTIPIKYHSVFPGTFTVNVVLNSSGTESDTRVALLAPMTGTHAFDFNQRYIDLHVVDVIPNGANPATILVKRPDDENVAPPGDYMLTVINKHGIPSAAKWVTVAP